MKYDKLKTLTDAAEYARKGHLDRAIAAYRTVIAHQPDEMQAHLELGDLLVRLGSPDEACDELERAAGLLRASGQTDAYLLVGEKRLALQPGNTPLRRELAGVCLRQNQPQRALGLLRGCYKAADTEPAELTLIAKTFVALDHHAGAVAALTALAEVHDRAGHRGLRDGALQKIRELDPCEPVDLSEVIDALLNAEHKAEQATELLEGVSELQSSSIKE